MKVLRFFSVVLTYVISLLLPGVSSAANVGTYTQVCADYSTCNEDYERTPPTTSTSFVSAYIEDVGGSGSSFDGIAEASATFTELKVLTSASLTGYTDIWTSYTNQGNIDPAAVAVAYAADTFMFPSADGFLLPFEEITVGFLLSFDGAISADHPVSVRLSSLFDILEFGDPGLPPDTFRVDSDDVRFSSVPESCIYPTCGLTVNLNADTEYRVFTSLEAILYPVYEESGYYESSDFNGIIDLSQTVTIDAILVTDADGNPIPGATLVTESGVEYQMSPLNAVPIPPALWLFGSGLLGLIGIARRKKTD